jgi:nitroreductase
LIDIGIACEHFVLQATEEGLGTCWIGWFNERAVKNSLTLKGLERVHILLAVGYCEREPLASGKRKNLEEMSEYR